MFDTHSHLQFAAFDEDRDAVVKRTLGAGVFMINVGTSYATSKAAVELAERHQEGVYAAVGLHPMYAGAEFVKIKHDPHEGDMPQEPYFDVEKYRALAASKKVAAIGEIGLDYYYKPKSSAKLVQFKEAQKKVCIQQLDLAQELNLPVILHCRVAHEDVISILKSRSGVRGVVHCFTGTWEQAEQYLQLGFYLGMNGIIFKLPMDEAVSRIPLDRMVMETDCPYLTPPQENGARNEPLFMRHTMQKIAQLKQMNASEVETITDANAKALFMV